jgi:lipopolysaccharide/colanic/teichoic acid biosynthesis glycosyltransferase
VLYRRIQIGIKHLLDKIVAIVLLVVLAPILIAIGIAIKAGDGGPVLFTQPRLGVNGRQFRIWKFRTMVIGADSLLNPDGSPSGDRITQVGKVLRFLSLDELPQLINIVVGDMSFVGPRPALISHEARYNNEQMQRLLVRPGVTGLAQISGRNSLKWSKRIELDLHYIDHYSLLLDMIILLKTIWVVILRKDIVIDRNPGEVDDLAKPRTRDIR